METRLSRQGAERDLIIAKTKLSELQEAERYLQLDARLLRQKIDEMNREIDTTLEDVKYYQKRLADFK